ncbi:sensor domain-containing diguanylate cyclase [Thermomonas sp. S9]|uniref:GGDEF domain-containing protein n=1 Tax=Thermomonas sp. S9 TaxID=2885203 RepID=UPI00216B6652|nr:sensor domain-containing diguanylate cyclase [Thermomonas sp. S9]MCR6497189.1 sensor domain-containing diguanylate cyclase [Thermomonas sp. S9]
MAATAVLLYAVLYRLLRDEAAHRLRQQRQREDLDLLNQFRESIIDNANIWLNVLDAQARITVWNKAAEQISGYRREEVIGGDAVWEWLYPDPAYRADIARRVRAILDDGAEVEGFETHIRCRDGQVKTMAWNQRRFFDERGQVGSIAIGQDITERKRLQDELERMAVHDPLTGLYNRREFELLAARRFADCAEAGHPYSLLWVDIDEFKAVNDRFGHQVGDEVLCGVAAVLQAVVGGHGIAARYGGDELVVALPQIALPEARALGEIVRQRVQEARLLAGCDAGTALTVSIGAAQRDAATPDLAALASAADAAMYRAKAGGRNRVCGPA